MAFTTSRHVLHNRAFTAPRLTPNNLALFSLLPLNAKARHVVDHPDNSDLISVYTGPDGQTAHVIDIGFHIPSTSPMTLATLGRSGCDVMILGSLVARNQCSFEININGLVMLSDNSCTMSTQFFGDDAIPFQRQRGRRAVVFPTCNTPFGMAGTNNDLVTFQIIWHEFTFSVKDEIRKRGARLPPKRITDDIPTGRSTGVHSALPPMALRYVTTERLGSGAFGAVFKGVDVEKGRLSSGEENQAVGGGDGSLSGWFPSLPDAGGASYLAKNNVIHRDVKPGNVLYSRSANGYDFVLGDFGVCNFVGHAYTQCGTENIVLQKSQGDLTYKPRKWISDAIRDLEDLKEMTELDVSRRAIAADMLRKLFGEENSSIARHAAHDGTLRQESVPEMMSASTILGRGGPEEIGETTLTVTVQAGVDNHEQSAHGNGEEELVPISLLP
ncbi:hypothetical protein AJ80_05156 [Polytolypa hystricis UAMH7299]|uniref:Protein kinase domain-containing protein n=1 Tax=Polytolypa hystricis (strain UAMH7299) TaxID=1447883 RepID=A0A2B7XXZ0_POLH7|nr:hypothetical protein AJ80_05156 [Polytolypa hystricis UAMH7299]